MKIEMVMPQMGESITEATISKWRKKVGDPVKKDEIILDISTDKVDSEIPAPAAGVITELLYKEGDVVPVKQKIAVIDSEASAGASASPPPRPAPKVEQPVTAFVAAESPSVGGATATVIAEPPPPPRPPSNGHPSSSASGRFYSPVVRSLAQRYGIPLTELDHLEGSGQGGRLTKQDFLDYLEQRGQQGASRPTPQPAPQSVPSVAAAPQQAPVHAPAPATVEYRPPANDMPSAEWGADGTKVIAMDKMRQLIAEHMVRSKHTSPHVYSIQEVDMSRVAQWRAKNKKDFEAKEGFGLSFTPFFLEAAVKALQKFPQVNSSVDGNKIILKRFINLGCAVAIGNTGLIVPVIKRAEERNIVGLARALNDLALRARDKKLLPDEVMNGTFTVTNPGVFGTMIGTPIINQPQAAILCLGQIKKRPVVVDDMIAIREICYLTLSYDHRIIDGALGGQFLAFIREYLEGWDLKRPLY